MAMIENLESMLSKGQDSAMLRLTLGQAYFEAGDSASAMRHLASAVHLDPSYSAAWKAYGKALAAGGETERARQAFERGIRVAEARGDLQAAKEMRVFLRRLRKHG